jgi:hypothetical protein
MMDSHRRHSPRPILQQAGMLPWSRLLCLSQSISKQGQHAMIIWLASYPRSGNTFFRMLLHYSCGLSTYSIYDDLLFDQLHASETIGHERLPASIDELAHADQVYFVKTHGLPMDANPAVYLVRDGRDVLVSFARYLQSFDSKRPRMRSVKGLLKDLFVREDFPAVLGRLIESSEHYGGWSGNVQGWLRRDRSGAGQTLVIRYEDLLVNPDACLQRVIEKCGIAPAAGGGRVMPDLATLHDRWPQFFRKGKAGSWREEMSRELHELFWQHHGETMQLLGYARGEALSQVEVPLRPVSGVDPDVGALLGVLPRAGVGAPKRTAGVP